jgi:hypothetical protein
MLRELAQVANDSLPARHPVAESEIKVPASMTYSPRRTTGLSERETT